MLDPEGRRHVLSLVKALNKEKNITILMVTHHMEEVILEGEGLLARAFCHEIDHLDGHMYTELVEGELHQVSYDEDEE